MVRNLVSVIALIAAALVSKASASIFDFSEPVMTAATFEKFYVPVGFDSNDHVQIVGEGMFKNTCYRPAPPSAHVDQATKTVYVGPVAYEYPGFCLQVVLPFERVIDVGVLTPGTWRIVQNADPAVVGEIRVSSALVDTPDDYHYASISQAFFQKKGLGGEVLLTGSFLNKCMSLEQVKVSFESDVIVLQPIVKVDTRSSCQPERTTFATTVKLDTIPKGRYLLHVRSMNGNAVNSLIDIN